jgi:L-iditol 2-dehydrogenase
MKTKMQGAVLYGKEDVRFESVDVPTPDNGEALIRIESAATCGTDLKVFHRGGHARMLRPPTLFGHEFSGVIEAVGDGTEFERGQRVACHNSAPCRECFYCTRAQFSLCENLLFLNGAFAEFIKVPAPIVAQNLHLLPDHLPYDEACLMEPLSCVVHGVERTPMIEGDTVVVIGDGAIGQMFVWLVSMKGMEVIHIGSRSHRLETGRYFGASQSLNYRESEDLVTKIRRISNSGRGADLVIECTGKPEVWEAAVQMSRPGGHVNLFGGCPRDTEFSVNTETVHYNEVTMLGVFHTTPQYVKQALDLLCAHPGKLRPLLSCELPLSELHRAFELMDEREAFKVSICNDVMSH